MIRLEDLPLFCDEIGHHPLQDDDYQDEGVYHCPACDRLTRGHILCGSCGSYHEPRAACQVTQSRAAGGHVMHWLPRAGDRMVLLSAGGRQLTMWCIESCEPVRRREGTFQLIIAPAADDHEETRS